MIYPGHGSPTEHAQFGELHIGRIGNCRGGCGVPASHVRMMAIKALLLGISHDQVAAFYTTRETLSRWVERFNERGIDGLIEASHGRRPERSALKSSEYDELIRHPELAHQSHWTGKKFHGHLTKELDQEIGYRTVVRWLHDKGFRLKVPRPWPNGQDEEKRKAFVELLRILLGDPEIDLWFLDETGIEGDPRPRRRWAQKGEKIRHPYQGTHLRMSVTGSVCPRTGEFYSLIFSHSDTEVFQTFLDNANQDISLERQAEPSDSGQRSMAQTQIPPLGKFRTALSSTLLPRPQSH